MSINWMPQPRERVLHEKIFDTISRPLSRATDNDSGMFSNKKVKWNHFGKKYVLRISDYEMEYADIFDALMKKIHEERPEFEGALAYIDNYGRQVIMNTDADIRKALEETKGKLKLHTTMPEGAVISAAEVAGRPTRSHSVPPPVGLNRERGYNAQSLSPGSHQSTPPSFQRSRAQSPNIGMEQPMHVNATQNRPYTPYGQMSPTYSTYSLKYGGYAPYSQNLLYGMPPHNGMLLRFLANPFPFGSYHRTFVGPNKYHSFGGWGGRYYGSGFGPIW